MIRPNYKLTVFGRFGCFRTLRVPSLISRWQPLCFKRCPPAVRFASGFPRCGAPKGALPLWGIVAPSALLGGKRAAAPPAYPTLRRNSFSALISDPFVLIFSLIYFSFSALPSAAKKDSESLGYAPNRRGNGLGNPRNSTS